MFDNVHFHKTVYHKDTQPLLAQSPGQLPETLLSELHDTHVFFRNSSFCLDGISLSCLSRPLTEFAYHNLLYIQSFSIFISSKDYFTRRHDFKSYLISYTYEGTGYLEYKGRTYRLEPGQGFFIDCRAPHYYKTIGTHWKHSELHFYGNCAEHIFQCFAAENLVVFSQPLDGAFIPMLEKLIELHDGIAPFRELQISTQLQSLLVMLLCNTPNYERAVRKIPEHLNYLLRYMENNYTKNLSLDYLSDFSGISKYHLCRLFKKYLDFTPNEYLMQLRMERAKKLLDETTLPANKIGNMVGIPDENYFYRLFKQRTGVSPRNYRKRNEKELI